MRSLALFQAEYELSVAHQRAAFARSVGELDLPGSEGWTKSEWPAMSSALPPDPARWKACRAGGDAFQFSFYMIRGTQWSTAALAVDARQNMLAAREDVVFPMRDSVLCALFRSFSKLSVVQQASITVRLHYGLRDVASRAQCLLDSASYRCSHCRGIIRRHADTRTYRAQSALRRDGR
jgi:hypothetical protein